LPDDPKEQAEDDDAATERIFKELEGLPILEKCGQFLIKAHKLDPRSCRLNQSIELEL